MAKNQIKLLAVPDALKGITGALKKSGGNVSDERAHSVDSHLRNVIRLCGYKPRESAAKKASAPELAEQASTCIDATTGKLGEARAAEIQMHLHSAHSNLSADAALQTAPELKEIPEAPAAPAKGPKEELSAKTVDELKEIAVEYGAEVPDGAKKSDLVTAILKKAGYAITLFILGLFLSLAPSARAQSNPDVFGNLTNVINPSAPIVAYPTNNLSTNFVTTSFSTNGSVITTNGFFLGTLTGKPVETRNYAWTGFYFQGLTTASNASGTIVFQLVRAKSASPPAVSTTANDFETTPSLTLTIPVPLGTNVPVTWMTNLDESYTKCANWIGIYSATNTTTGTAGCSNAVAGVTKKILPVALSGGNF